MKKFAGIFLVLAAFSFMAGCIDYPKYHVYYSGNGNTSGYPPVDSQAYSSGDTVVVLGSGSIKKDDAKFLGWRQRSSGDRLYQPGREFTLYEDVHFYAVWEGDDVLFGYKVESDAAIITSYNKDNSYNSDEVIIPDTLGGYPVTRIGDNAFQSKYIYQIVLPAALTSIGNGTFSSNMIEALELPNTVTEIGTRAFQANHISKLELGSGLETIGAYAFSGNSVTNLILPYGLITVGAGAFERNDIVCIDIGNNVDIKSDSSMGINGGSFRLYYDTKGKASGIYLYDKNGWRGPAQ